MHEFSPDEAVVSATQHKEQAYFIILSAFFPGNKGICGMVSSWGVVCSLQANVLLMTNHRPCLFAFSINAGRSPATHLASTQVDARRASAK